MFSVQEFSVQEGDNDAKLKGYIEPFVYSSYRSRYRECNRMLNGLEKSLEKHLSARSMADLLESERRWTAQGRLSFSFDLEAFRPRATRLEPFGPELTAEGLVDKSQGRGVLDRLNSEH